VAKERELIQVLRRYGRRHHRHLHSTTRRLPADLGEHVAWGDTGTVIYANSVLARARTSSPALRRSRRRSPTHAGVWIHLDEHRRGTFAVELKAKLDDLADWGAVGKIVGESHQDYFPCRCSTASIASRPPTS